MTQEPIERLVTIGEIAAGARHLAKDPFAFSERCRHWARLGLLQAVKQAGEGAGRHALFPRTETYMAGVVAALAEIGLQPGGSRPMADIQAVARDGITIWLETKVQKKLRPRGMQLRVSFYAGGIHKIAMLDGPQKPKLTAESATSLKARQSDQIGRPITVLTLNFDSLFESVFERLLFIDGGVVANTRK